MMSIKSLGSGLCAESLRRNSSNGAFAEGLRWRSLCHLSFETCPMSNLFSKFGNATVVPLKGWRHHDTPSSTARCSRQGTGTSSENIGNSNSRANVARFSSVVGVSSNCCQDTVVTLTSERTTPPESVIRQTQRQLASGDRSAVEIVEQYMQTAEALEPQLGSFLHLNREVALQQARALDSVLVAARARGDSDPLAATGRLSGVATGVKDNLCTRDMPSTAGSRVLEGYQPPADATAVERLRAEGGVVMGKTNMDEFGMGSTTEGSGYKLSSNPWDLSRVPGGSSGGSAAAVASGQCAVALGSDTGGSVRQPASFCGIVGLKPSYGRVSRHGLMAYASSLDVIGCLTGSVEDAALLLTAIAGRDHRDATSSSKTIPDFSSLLLPLTSLSSSPLAGRRFGIVRETTGEQGGVDADVRAAVDAAARHLESLGAEVEEVSLPFFAHGLPAYYVLAPSEASSNLARYDGVRFGPSASAEDLGSLYCNSRGAGFGKEVKRRILMGTYALSAGYYDAYYKRAQQVRTLIRQQFDSALSSYDALITPTAPTAAYVKGEKSSDPLSMYLGDLMTVNVNLAGLPAISLPCGFTTPTSSSPRLPIGMQLIGKHFAEADLLHLSHVYEQTANVFRA